MTTFWALGPNHLILFISFNFPNIPRRLHSESFIFNCPPSFCLHLVIIFCFLWENHPPFSRTYYGNLRRAINHGIICVFSCSVFSDSFDPMDSSPPVSFGIFQARILEYVAISYSMESSWPKEPMFLASSELAGSLFMTVPPGKPRQYSPISHKVGILSNQSQWSSLEDFES